MISENKNFASQSPIVKLIVLAVMKNFHNKNFVDIQKQRSVIDTSVVPKFSQRITRAFVEGPLNRQIVFRKNVEHPKRNFQVPPKNFGVPQPAFTSSNFTEVRGNYGEIDSLIKDPSVSSIECQGAGKIILIVRAGQKMQTKISLSEEQIKKILEIIADNAKVPLLDGVFRVAVDNFVINAVVSEMIGSRFVIKKQTPYAILEK